MGNWDLSLHFYFAHRYWIRGRYILNYKLLSRQLHIIRSHEVKSVRSWKCPPQMFTELIIVKSIIILQYSLYCHGLLFLFIVVETPNLFIYLIWYRSDTRPVIFFCCNYFSYWQFFDFYESYFTSVQRKFLSQ